MELFKTTDEKLRDIGFVKVGDGDHGAFYERLMPEGYTQVVSIARKYNGRHTLQSYDKGLFGANYTGNICVGLTYQEARLFLRKMREIGLDREV